VILKCLADGIVKWSEIAERIPGRIGKQCRERYFNHLDREWWSCMPRPSHSIPRGRLVTSICLLCPFPSHACRPHHSSPITHHPSSTHPSTHPSIHASIRPSAHVQPTSTRPPGRWRRTRCWSSSSCGWATGGAR